MTGPTRIAFAPARLCFRRLRRGDCKRVMPVGPLVGYYICCPACGRTFQYLADVVGFVESGGVKEKQQRRACDLGGPEDDESERTVTVEHPEWLSAARPMQCYGCARWMTLRLNEITVTVERPNEATT